MLVPELDVVDLTTSLRFYVGVLELRVLFERPAERFAYLERLGAEVMIQEAAGPGRRFSTAPLEAPYGRGVNFQLRVAKVDATMTRAIEAGAEIVVPMEELVQGRRRTARRALAPDRTNRGRQPSVRGGGSRWLPVASIPGSRRAPPARRQGSALVD